MTPIQVIKSACTILSMLAETSGTPVWRSDMCPNFAGTCLSVNVLSLLCTQPLVNPGTRRTGELLRSHFYGCSDGLFAGFTVRQCNSTSGEDREDK